MGMALLVLGTNVLAVQVFNVTMESSDLCLDAALKADLQAPPPPVVRSVAPPPGPAAQLNLITVTFSEAVVNVAAADLLLNDNPARAVSGGGSVYTFEFDPPAPGEVFVSWSPDQRIAGLATPPNAFRGEAAENQWSYQLAGVKAPVVADVHPPAGMVLRQMAEVQIRFAEPVTGLDPADLRLNGEPALAVSGISAGPYRFVFAAAAVGVARMSWAEGHGIVSGLGPSEPLAGVDWEYRIDPSATAGDVVIHEVMAENAGGMKDEDGETEDWIELHNRGRTPVNLHGWSLTDDADEPRQWVFPPVQIAGGQYLVVFASGKDRRVVSGSVRLHTNFKLNLFGEYLGLYPPDSPPRAASELAPEFPEQRHDVAYGRDGAGQWRYFSAGTPWATNNAAALGGIVEPVHFSVQRGYLRLPFRLFLHSPTPGSAIRFSMDGTTPTSTNGLLYTTNGIWITSTRAVRAVAWKAGWLPSRVDTHTYLLNQLSSRLTLPALSLTTDNRNLYGTTGIMEVEPRNTIYHGIAWERPVSAELIRPGDNGGFQVDCGIRIQGGAYIRERYDYRSSSLPANKYSFRLYFRGDYGPTRLEYPLFPDCGMDKFDHVVLRAGMNDHSNPFLRDELARRLFADTGQVSSHGGFVHLFLNGAYKGYYNPTERIDADFLQSWHGGGKEWDLVAQRSEVVEGDLTAWNALRNYVNTMSPATPAYYREIERRFDLENFVDYLLVNIYGATADWPHNNWRAGRERSASGRFRYYIWDAEMSYGYRNAVSWNTLSNELAGTTEVAKFYQRLRLSPEFRLLFADRAHRHLYNGGALADERIQARYEQLRAMVQPSISGFNNTIGTSWIPSRRRHMLEHLAAAGLLASSNAPVLSPFGGRVRPGTAWSLRGGAGSVYYTLDGTDPRVAFTGAVAPSARVFAPGQSLVLTQSVEVSARTLQGANWSALTRARFQVAEVGCPLRISEIMYRPPDGEAGEFIELENTGVLPLDLSGFQFEGIEFRFPEGTPPLPPGGRLVLIPATNPVLFQQRYPGVSYAGTYRGALSNSGERVAILDRAGRTVASVEYGVGNGWPASANGGGHSIEWLGGTADPDDPANWSASGQSGGSPGASNRAVLPQSIWINEVRADGSGSAAGAEGMDWIELYNPGIEAVDLTQWSLSDGDDPRQFVFPASTVLERGAYLVVGCRGGSGAGSIEAGFGLDAEGDRVFLYDAQTNRVDAVAFGPLPTGYGFGRGAGGGGWVLTEPTPGDRNEPAALAPVTKVVVNEFQANPPPGDGDWLELRNLDPDRPAALQGAFLATSNALFEITAPVFVDAGGHVRLWADEEPGADHVDFKLSAAGGAIALWDSVGIEWTRINYGAQREGTVQGRWPDGTGAWVAGQLVPTPGASNFVAGASTVRFNEIMAVNRQAVLAATGRYSDWFEIRNLSGTEVDLEGVIVRLESADPYEWAIPAGVRLGAGEPLLVWADGRRPASTSNEDDLNFGRNLPGEGAALWLVSPAGGLWDRIEFGFQIPDRSIGLVGGAGPWRLLAEPTPGLENSAAMLLGALTQVRLNEWLASGEEDGDWIELHNTADQPVQISGLILTDDPTLAGQTNHIVGPLSFIDRKGHVVWRADGQTDRGPDHVRFSLDQQGETLRIYHTNLTAIDSVDFGPQAPGISSGRLPEGSSVAWSFAAGATPGASNYEPLTNVVVSEVMGWGMPPLEGAIELFNPTMQPVAIGGWFLSDQTAELRKYRLPAGLVLPPLGYRVFYQADFGEPAGATNRLSLDPLRAGEVHLSQVDAYENLTGWRAVARFGPAPPNESSGRILTSVGVDYASLERPTFGVDRPLSIEDFRRGSGAANAAPRMGPLTIQEIHYHPVDGETGDESRTDEFIELLHGGPGDLILGDPERGDAPWRLSGGVEFDLPAGAVLGPGEVLVVAGFDPQSEPGLLSAFCARFNVPAGARIVGPWSGRLDNSGERIEIWRPGQPAGAGQERQWIPDYLVEAVEYDDRHPWPEAADGGGASLQRLSALAYGNEPLNWEARPPTPGRLGANGEPGIEPPAITRQPVSQHLAPGATLVLEVGAEGAPPLEYQWYFNGLILDGMTNRVLELQGMEPFWAGRYQAIVRNAAGAAPSEAADVRIEPFFRFERLALRSDGAVEIGLTMPFGTRYVVQGSTNMIDWVDLLRGTFYSTRLEFSDPDAAERPMRFYRVLEEQ